MSVASPLDPTADKDLDELGVVGLLERRRHAARNRETDEILSGRIQVSHYYTGVADGLAFALELLEEPEGSA